MMPHKVTLREAASVDIGGVPVTVAHARGKLAILFVAAYDSDGLLETKEDCVRAATRFRQNLDVSDQLRNDKGTEVNQPIQAEHSEASDVDQ
jgi:hypothetical protein